MTWAGQKRCTREAVNETSTQLQAIRLGGLGLGLTFVDPLGGRGHRRGVDFTTDKSCSI